MEAATILTGAELLHDLFREETKYLNAAGIARAEETGERNLGRPESVLLPIRERAQRAEGRLRIIRLQIQSVDGWTVIPACGMRIPVELRAPYRFYLTDNKGRIYYLQGRVIAFDGYWIILEKAISGGINFVGVSGMAPDSRIARVEGSIRFAGYCLPYMFERADK